MSGEDIQRLTFYLRKLYWELLCARYDEENRSLTGKLCKQIVWFELKVMLISGVRWPPGRVSRRPTACPNIPSAFRIHVFWLTLIASCVAPSAQSSARQGEIDLFHDVQTEFSAQGWSLGAFHTWNISGPACLESAFVHKDFHRLENFSSHNAEQNFGEWRPYWAN